ncbi:hypothetical protein MKY48_30645 [Paenibacillus sp. FSL W8-0187]|uniref:hypothetical protein n=1 Tax=Paenibacillus sp. FSL W8-0187 TaxID=2921710 RepID=UPI0030DACEA7
MKSKFFKIAFIIFNALLFVCLVFLVKSEFQNVESKKEASQETQSKAPSNAPSEVEEVDILSLLNSEHSDLFAESSLQASFKEGSLASSKVSKDSKVLGNFDDITNLNGNLFVASGWLFLEKLETDYIVFVDKDNVVLGAGVFGINREGLSEALGIKNVDNNGWVGYLKIESNEAKVYALSKLRDKDEYIEVGKFDYSRKE